MVRRDPDVRADPGPALEGVLQALVADRDSERLTLGQIIHAMGERAFGPLLFIFAVPNILPTPPGTAGIMAIPLVFLTVQMVLGRVPWLPGFLVRRSVARETFARFVARAAPWLAWAGRFLRPRLGLFVRPMSERLVGLVCLFLSLVLLMPIPFANSAPAFAICLFGLGLLERDGVWILAGMIAAAGATALAGFLGFALVKAAVMFVQHLMA